MEYSIKQTIINFIRENKFEVAAYLFFTISYPLGEVVLPHYYGKIIDDLGGVEHADAGKGKSSKSGGESKGALVLNSMKTNGIIVVLLWIVIQIFSAASNKLDMYMVPKLQSYIRKNIVMNVLETYKENHKEMNVGELIARIVKLPVIIRDLDYQTKAFFIPTLWILISSVIYFFSIDVGLGSIALAGIAMFFTTIYSFTNTCMAASDDYDTSNSSLHNEIGDMFKNLMNIYAADTIEEELIRFEKLQEKMDKKYTDTIKCSSSFKKWFGIAYMILFVMINGFSLHLFSTGKIHIKQVTSILIVSLYLVSHLRSVSSEILDFVIDIGVVSSAQTFLNKLKSYNLSKGDKTMDDIDRQSGGAILFKGVNMSYGGGSGKEKAIFTDFNLEIKSKQKVAIVGKIGSGKSTLIHLLMKLKPYTGLITIDGQDLAECESTSIRQQITYVPQLPTLFNRSIYENIVYGTGDKYTKEDVAALLSKLQLGSVFGDHTLDSVIGEGAQLSGGQQRTIFLLRCLLRDNQIIVMDEPTTSLDNDSLAHIMRILQELMRNKTVIIITHDPSLLKYVDRVITLSKGKIVSDTLGKK